MHSIPSFESYLAAHCRKGHFAYESGDHGDLWIDLDAMLADMRFVEAWAQDLSTRIKEFSPELICGPQSGGARLAECVARQLSIQFVYTERDPSAPGPPARYIMPARMKADIQGRSVVVIDDAINAGSAVSATIVELESQGARVVAIGCLLTLNEKAQVLANSQGVPLVRLHQLQQCLWPAADCPVCREV